MEQKPLPLTGGDEAEYLLGLKQDFRVAMRSLPCFIQPVVTHRGQWSHSAHLSADVLQLYCESFTCVSCADVERYSDKYNRSEQMDRLLDWAPGEAPPTAGGIYPIRNKVKVTRSSRSLDKK